MLNRNYLKTIATTIVFLYGVTFLPLSYGYAKIQNTLRPPLLSRYHPEALRDETGAIERAKALQDKVTGIHVPFATIWDSKGNIDGAGQKALVSEVSPICDGFFFGGSSGGLGDALTASHIAKLVDIGVKVREELGREDIIIECGACGATAKVAAEMAVQGVEARADLVVLPPPYFKNEAQKAGVRLPTDPQKMDEYVFNFYRNFWEITHLAFVVYNIPGACNGYQISPELLDRIFKEIPGAVGIKDSSTKAEVTKAYIEVARKYPGKKVLSGFWPTKGALLGERPELDADGGVPIEANYVKFIAFVLRIAQLARDSEAVALIQDILQREVLDEVVGGKERKGFPNLVNGTVRALYKKGIGGNFMPQGQAVLDPSLNPQVDAVVEQFGNDEKQKAILLERGVPEQYIRQAEAIIEERRARELWHRISDDLDDVHRHHRQNI